MRYLLISVDNYQFFDEPINKGLLGGKIIASNSTTKEEIFRVYKNFHTGKTNKFDVLEKFVAELVPPKSEPQEETPVEN